MLRKVVAVFRSAIVGPNLAQLSRFTNAEIGTLSLLLSEDPVTQAIMASGAAAGSNPAPAARDPADLAAVDGPGLHAVRHELASLKERVEVLERLSARQSHARPKRGAEHNDLTP